MLNKAFARWFFWPSHPMPRSLNAYLKNEITGSDFAIHYYIGGGLGGKTDFRLRGDGSYQLWSTATRGRLKKSYCGQVPTCQVEQVAERMLATRVWKVRHDHASRWLDDAGAKICVFAKGQESEVMLWLSEVRESPPFTTAQNQLLSLIHDISAGEVLENGQ